MRRERRELPSRGTTRKPHRAAKAGRAITPRPRLPKHGSVNADELIPERHMIDEPVTQYQVESKDDQRAETKDEDER
jgi:hypothetical protein